MSQANLFSASERSILIIITLLMCFTFYQDISNKIIDSYNENVKLEQLRLLNRANNTEDFHFTLYDPCRSFSLWEFLIALQFFTNPIVPVLLRSQKPGRFIFALFINSLTFLAYFAWAYNAFHSMVLNQFYIIQPVNFGGYLFPQSTMLQQFSFVLVSFLLILQIFILARFLLEKFDPKVSLA